MHTCQCEGCQMRQSNGVLLKEMAAFQRCPLIEVALYSIMDKLCTYVHMYVCIISCTQYKARTA